MARRRMRRQTRRFLLTLSTVGVCVVLASMGIKWVFSSEPTELTGTIGPDELSPAGPALRAIAPPSELAARPGGAGPAPGKAAARHEPPKTSTEKTALPELPRTEPPKPGTAHVPVPPASQPLAAPRLSAGDARKELDAGFAALERKELVAARTHLNNALHGGLSPADETRVREALTDLAEKTIFSRSAARDDSLVRRHTIKSGEKLASIARRYKVSDDLLAEINGIVNKNRIREGQTIKVIEGPFNAAVVKKDHQLHVYLQDVYLRSFDVALGMDGSTPTGTWKVKDQLKNPDWVDPSGKRWHANDPNNPIGEFWIGLEGIDGEALGKVGFGIHGTVEPETIGQDVSLGCVRLAADNIATLYKLLVPGVSITTISE